MSSLVPPSSEQVAHLREQALAARERSYAPYSQFRVGAALLCDDGSVVLGCNVENASYGLCVCAERTAIGCAIAQGQRRFRAIAIATGSSPPSPPCGMCRQVLSEFCDDLPIHLVTPEGEVLDTTLRALFPSGFDKGLLERGIDASPRKQEQRKQEQRKQEQRKQEQKPEGEL